MAPAARIRRNRYLFSAPVKRQVSRPPVQTRQTTSPTHLRSAVDLFLNGEWASTATSFTLCTTFRLESTKILAEIEEQRKRLRVRSVALEIWDAAELDILLKAQAEIVDDFFGRPHSELFSPPEALEALRSRITGPTVAELRATLEPLHARLRGA